MATWRMPGFRTDDVGMSRYTISGCKRHTKSAKGPGATFKPTKGTWIARRGGRGRRGWRGEERASSRGAGAACLRRARGYQRIGSRVREGRWELSNRALV